MPFVQRFRSSVIVIPPYVLRHPTFVLLRIPCCWQSTLVVAVGFAVGKQYPVHPAVVWHIHLRLGINRHPVSPRHLRHYAIVFFGIAYAVGLSRSRFAYVDVSFAICLWSPRHCLPDCPIAIDCPPYHASASPHAFAFVLLHRPRNYTSLRTRFHGPEVSQELDA
jgi:hypothetical protein